MTARPWGIAVRRAAQLGNRRCVRPQRVAINGARGEGPIEALLNIALDGHRPKRTARRVRIERTTRPGDNGAEPGGVIKPMGGSMATSERSVKRWFGTMSRNAPVAS
jgi:hypothetical protein